MKKPYFRTALAGTFTVLVAIASATLPHAALAQPAFGVQATDYYGTTGTEGSLTASRQFSYSNVQSLASGGLAGGDLHARVWSEGSRGNVNGARATITFWDTITFHNARGLSLLGSTQLSIDGQLAQPAGSSASATVGYYYGDRPSLMSDIGSKISYQQLASGSTEIDSGLFVPLGDSSYFIWCQLSVEASVHNTEAVAYADFGHTLHLDFDLPEGVTFTSASGTFLSAAPVPEPGSGVLLLAGVMGIGFVARRRTLAAAKRQHAR